MDDNEKRKKLDAEVVTVVRDYVKEQPGVYADTGTLAAAVINLDPLGAMLRTIERQEKELVVLREQVNSVIALAEAYESEANNPYYQSVKHDFRLNAYNIYQALGVVVQNE